MNLALSFNKAYLDYALVMLVSFCETNREHNEIYVLHSELESADTAYIKEALSCYDAELVFLNVTNYRWDLSTLPTMQMWSREIYYRLMLPDIMPENVDRILYLDVDTIVHRPLNEFYYQDFDGNDIVACVDSNGKEKPFEAFTEFQQSFIKPLWSSDFKYFNSGVILFNIAQMRENFGFDYYLSIMESWDYKMSAPDQDVLNYAHFGKVKFASSREFNLFARQAYNEGYTYEDLKGKNYIIHYVGNKPWDWMNTHFEFERLWWEFAALTPSYEKLMERFVESALSENRLENEAIRLNSEGEQLADALKEADAVLKRFEGFGN